ncbi:TIGR00730 family Rossman fold protein [Corynebacterium sp. zg254]|uniref:Cytokinin riboside 5'-monophosphate phosphoribohydrolase n=1 Tax=Corynebacterium zhongnanshanii TaxID=2768834 RepID=A0ABQ6VE77_9CORY|nr:MULTISPECIES: TIGR00730 family Rossman fold protein [Corynebacterium]KAB3522694.1 TIGR00730 family Rossman fold protein [Corynebacterium zhongnanshanii]MCR5914253.1 TIGR00730 family Rossman fold protein [Corynebacterium sp. zg254]
MNITVYCGAALGTNPIYKEAAIQVGTWIADHGHTLVFGGGNTGLMGTVADAALAGGAEVIGIIPEFLTAREPAHSGVTELITVDDMSTRKLMLFERGDAFLALPGGPGTLEEITDVISWARIGQNDKPCVLFNVNDYYAHLQAQFDHMVEEGFLSRIDRESILFSDDLEQVTRFIDPSA